MPKVNICPNILYNDLLDFCCCCRDGLFFRLAFFCKNKSKSHTHTKSINAKLKTRQKKNEKKISTQNRLFRN